ncbi:bifunctional protein-disulfide isomerase/oxidoreductase DsbC [Shewanella sp. JNE10-2]|uniref:bifunctional protein-disulfide isomerase/oxidoreductase DsbC n=1 Tax=unclassified Shewanella TaxID=196818 RepID=UPI0020061123|nr:MULTISPECIES: bifunctional protein-disulfide isomerase/oxidoreductase DsbC [unclassified Shewanella]MCK7630405.1 bifunctional protein-disulfide isomerase/oxidoreductase DsbC [Shewanella sp. JNE9-1]MCK7633582.1 bifunctional protein-disulfide isomerase/oxidoreductase DsbC [Shewanella sp. JNE17]MCK7645572.1 bifunctional protein-disulfide isomerase/oxidoreductase DsbC [Shewanella sp. JNE3-1]MCK7648659.1 bifunctional protein-disulfide isomerase/oxidoreductase DsbC [Shewanella sp. JNE8]MCK7653565
MKLTPALSLVFTLLVAPLASATTTTSPDTAAIKQKLSEMLDVEVISMQDAPVEGLYQAMTNRGVLYISRDGSKLFHGNVYDIDKGMKNLTEAALAGPRIAMMKPLEDHMLVYKAKNEKHVITVFTDVSCGYCRKLHSQMDEYNKLGITVRYLAFPRAGVPSANADEMQAIWCAKDPLKAMTNAKAGQTVPAATCDAKIAEQYALGTSFGVNGTPAMILADGSMIPGYQPPEDLLRTLDMRQ